MFLNQWRQMQFAMTLSMSHGIVRARRSQPTHRCHGSRFLVNLGRADASLLQVDGGGAVPQQPPQPQAVLAEHYTEHQHQQSQELGAAQREQLQNSNNNELSMHTSASAPSPAQQPPPPAVAPPTAADVQTPDAFDSITAGHGAQDTFAAPTAARTPPTAAATAVAPRQPHTAVAAATTGRAVGAGALPGAGDTVSCRAGIIRECGGQVPE